MGRSTVPFSLGRPAELLSSSQELCYQLCGFVFCRGAVAEWCFHVQKACCTLVYRGLQQAHLKTSSSCEFDNFYGKWTFCCLVSRRRWYLESSWMLCKGNLIFFWLVSLVYRLKAWVCDWPYNNPSRTLLELAHGKGYSLWVLSPLSVTGLFWGHPTVSNCIFSISR